MFNIFIYFIILLKLLELKYEIKQVYFTIVIIQFCSIQYFNFFLLMISTLQLEYFGVFILFLGLNI